MLWRGEEKFTGPKRVIARPAGPSYQQAVGGEVRRLWQSPARRSMQPWPSGLEIILYTQALALLF